MNRFRITVIAILILLLMTGCDGWQTGSYYSVTPHQEEDGNHLRETMEARNYTELVEILEQQVTNGSESCIIYIYNSNFSNVEAAVEGAVSEIMQLHPIGAFAVEAIDYDIGASTGRSAVAVNITYNRSRSDILRIQHAEDMDGALTVITDALESCDAGVVVQVEDYTQMDITQKVQDYMDAHPDTCMEMPQVSVAVYPQAGKVRVVEILFTYQTSRDVLRTMQEYVQPVFRAAGLNVSGEEEESVKFNRMYAFLMERNDYQLETSITPTYSLLRYGEGDSKAFATVYAAMCRSAGLECLIVSGTKSGEPWTWNMICEDGVYYHVDLIDCNREGELLRRSQNQMEGYVWDYTAYPEAEPPKEPEPAPNQSQDTPEATQPETSQPTEPEPTDPVPEETEPEPVAPDVTEPNTEPMEENT